MAYPIKPTFPTPVPRSFISFDLSAKRESSFTRGADFFMYFHLGSTIGKFLGFGRIQNCQFCQ